MGTVRSYLQSETLVQYVLFGSWLPVKWRPSFFPGALLQIIQERPDVVLCMANISQFTELLALPLCKLLGIRFVWWTHGYEHGSPNMWGLKKVIWTLMYKCADGVITFSKQGRSFVIGMGLDGEKVFCAPNTLDTELLRSLAIEAETNYTREALAKELSFNTTDRVLLFSGRLMSRKKIEYAIIAVSRLVEKYQGIHLVIIGDGPEMENLKILADNILSGRCHFLGPVYNERALAKVFTLAELFLMPRWVGLAIVHAFSFGLPIITERSNIHAPEIQYLRDGYNGLLYDKDNIDDFVEKIEQLLADNNMRVMMSANAIKTAEEEASIKNMITQMGLALGLENGTYCDRL